uniref:Uncharacterized protein n=1 Tax=Arundo donax TaxID=35708 RepID=A0A0A8ZWJ0_ARUDO
MPLKNDQQQEQQLPNRQELRGELPWC